MSVSNPGMRLLLATLLVCLWAGSCSARAAHPKRRITPLAPEASLVEVKSGISVSSVSVGVNPACGPNSYIWPSGLQFPTANGGAVIFTLASGFNDLTVGISATDPASGRDPSNDLNFVEVDFGAYGNAYTLIRTRKQTNQIARDYYPNVVVSGKQYWVSLVNYKVSMGVGNKVGQNVLSTGDMRAIIGTASFPGKYVGFACWPGLNSGRFVLSNVVIVSDCVVGPWGAPSACTVSCGKGTQTLSRSLISDVSGQEYGATGCPAFTSTQDCNTQPCPIDCEMDTWAAWGACTNDCGSGIQKRSRNVKTPSANGGAGCGPSGDIQQCNTQPCPINCEWSPWGPWSDCSDKCGGLGTRSAQRTMTRDAQFSGQSCSKTDGLTTQPCNTMPCPVDCVVTDWGDWTACSLLCGTGQHTRSRKITTNPDFGGTACPALDQQEGCNQQPCPIDCQLSEWSGWGDCDSQCGTGSQSRSRTILTPPSNNGLECAALDDLGACNTQECPVDKLAELVKRLRHLETVSRVNSLEEQQITNAQSAVEQTAFDFAASSINSDAVATAPDTSSAALLLETAERELTVESQQHKRSKQQRLTAARVQLIQDLLRDHPLLQIEPPASSSFLPPSPSSRLSAPAPAPVARSSSSSSSSSSSLQPRFLARPRHFSPSVLQELAPERAAIRKSLTELLQDEMKH